MFCNLLLSTSNPRVFSVCIRQIGKRPECFSSVCVFGGWLLFLFCFFGDIGLPGQKWTLWGGSCFSFILISEVKLL